MEPIKPGNKSPRGELPLEHPDEKKEGGAWFGGWFADLGKKWFGGTAEEAKGKYVEKEGGIGEGAEKKILEREAEREGKREFKAFGYEVPKDAFSQAVVGGYNERVYKNQEKNWDIIFSKLESVFEGFDRKQYEENPVKFFSDLVSNGRLIEIFNKTILSDEECGNAWKLIADERMFYFYDLVDSYYSDDIEYRKACERFNQLIEREEMAREKAEGGDWSFAKELELDVEFRKEYDELQGYFNERSRAYFNSMEARYYENDLKFQNALKVVQDMKDGIFEERQSGDLGDMAEALHEVYQKGEKLEDIESGEAIDFKDAVDYINQREVALKALFGFGYAEEEVEEKVAIPSLRIGWEGIKEQAVRDKGFTEKHPGVEFMPGIGVVAFVMTSPVSFPTEKVGNVFGDQLGRKAIQVVLTEGGKEEEKTSQSLSSGVSTLQQSSAGVSGPQKSSAAVLKSPAELRLEMIRKERRRTIFNKTWDEMFKEVTEKMKRGWTYDAIKEEYGEKWEEKFKIGFDEVFKDLRDVTLLELRVRLRSAEYREWVDNLKEKGFYEGFPLSKEDKGYKEAVAYIEKREKLLESNIINKRKTIFYKTWDEMFKKIKDEILRGKPYNEIRKRYEKEWVENFKIEFSMVFKELAAMKERESTEKDKEKLAKMMNEAEVALREKAFREEIKDFVEIAWGKEIQKDKVLEYSLMVMIETRRDEEARLAQKMMKFLENIEGDESVKAFYSRDNPIKLRYEKILMEAKLHDYSQAEIDIALEVRGKFFEAFKKHFGGVLDMRAWRVLVSREPMLEKAERLIIQKQYDNICVEFERIEFLKKQEAKGEEMTAEEMVLIEKGYLELLKNGLSLVAKSMLPWKVVEEPGSLRTGGSNVEVNLFPGIKEMGDMVAYFMRTGVGGKRDVAAEMITSYAKKLDTSIRGLSTEVAEFVQDVPTGKWGIDRNRFLVHDYTADAKESRVARGIKWLLKETGMVEEPEAIKSQKWMPWLAKYGKAAVVGVGAAVGATVLSGRVPSMMTVFAGMGAGAFWARYSAPIKAAMISAIPGAITGAVVGTVVVVLTGLSGGVIVGVIGLGAVLFGIFGLWAMYGGDRQKGIAEYVYSDEIARFNQWHDRIEMADLGRIEFNRAAAKARARSGQMGLRAELGQDQRYKNLEDVCREVGLSAKARDEFLEQVRKKPSVLGEPEEFRNLLRSRSGGLTEDDEAMISKIIEKYRAKSKGILKVGLERRYENLRDELMKLGSMMPEVIGELEGKYGKNLLDSDGGLKDMLVSRGVSASVIDRIFKEVRPGEKETKVMQAMNQLARAVGMVGELGTYISNIPLGAVERKKREMEAEEVKAKEFERDEAFVRVVLALREVIKKKEMLMDEGEMKKLLVAVGLEEKVVENLYKVYDKKNLEHGGVKVKAMTERDNMERDIIGMSDDELLALDIIMQGQENYIERMKVEERMPLLSFEFFGDFRRGGELKPDEELLSEDEIEDISERYANDGLVLDLLEKARDVGKDGDIPDGIPRDEVLMRRFGLWKVDARTNKVLGLDELPDVIDAKGNRIKARDYFEDKKDILEKNFDKLRIGLKRKKLEEAARDELIQKKKDEHVAKIMERLWPGERETRIESRRIKIMREYIVDPFSSRLLIKNAP